MINPIEVAAFISGFVTCLTIQWGGRFMKMIEERDRLLLETKKISQKITPKDRKVKG